MSSSWRDDDEDYKVGGGGGGGGGGGRRGSRHKPRFSFKEVKLLLDGVKRNRFIILKKYNQGVSAEAKKQTWAEITNQINSLGENHREVRQIMKKWADLKCDGKRRAIALRGPNGSNLKKKNLGPVEKMVNKILMMSPSGEGGDSDMEVDDEDFSKLYGNSSYSYLSLTDSSHSMPGGASFDLSPLSSPEKELSGDPFQSSSDFDVGEEGECMLDFEENDDSLFSSYPSSVPPPASTSLEPLPDNALLRMKPVHTYSRNSQQTSSPRPPSGPSTSSSSAFPDPDAPSSSAAAPPPPPPSSQSPTNMTASSLTPPPSSSSIPPPPPPPPTAVTAASSSSSASSSHEPSPSSSNVPPPNNNTSSSSSSSDPLPAGASSRRVHDHVAQMASQSLQQQRASRMLLTSVSQSLEMLAQSVQLLVENQQEFVQESLTLQRETVEILRDFSNTALTVLRDKTGGGGGGGGQLVTHQPSGHL